MTQVEEIRSHFPALSQQVYGKPLVYLDNAATSQKPDTVIELLNRMNSFTNANIHRAVHKLSADATQLYEQGRESVLSFINASKREEIIFTSGTTASINLIANTFGEKYLKKGDVVLLSEAEHHSNIVPWQIVCQRKGAEIKYIPVDENGCFDMEQFDLILDERVKFISVCEISNVLGLRNPIEDIVEKGHRVGAQILVDGAQGIVHNEVDVQKSNCDYYAFSGHKVFAATGIGILYGKERLLEELPPWMGGGDMVNTVSYKTTTFAELPLKFEAGTPNFIGGASFTPALKFAKSVRTFEGHRREKAIVSYLMEQLQSIEGLRLYGIGSGKTPLFSFSVEETHHSDIALLLDKMGVAVRSGLMCAEPLIDKYGQTGLVRASFAQYNTMEEAEYFVDALKRAITILR